MFDCLLLVRSVFRLTSILKLRHSLSNTSFTLELPPFLCQASPGADAAADIDGDGGGGGGDGRMSDGGDDDDERDEGVDESPVGSPAPEVGVLAVEESPASVRAISVSPSSRHGGDLDAVDSGHNRFDRVSLL